MAAQKLPKDDGEFYQFCYVTASGHVRGASAPFQFKQPSLDDLIEIEDENGELLVIRTKTAILEEQLKKANEQRLQLKQVGLLTAADMRFQPGVVRQNKWNNNIIVSWFS